MPPPHRGASRIPQHALSLLLLLLLFLLLGRLDAFQPPRPAAPRRHLFPSSSRLRSTASASSSSPPSIPSPPRIELSKVEIRQATNKDFPAIAQSRNAVIFVPKKVRKRRIQTCMIVLLSLLRTNPFAHISIPPPPPKTQNKGRRWGPRPTSHRTGQRGRPRNPLQNPLLDDRTGPFSYPYIHSSIYLHIHSFSHAPTSPSNHPPYPSIHPPTQPPCRPSPSLPWGTPRPAPPNTNPASSARWMSSSRRRKGPYPAASS